MLQQQLGAVVVVEKACYIIPAGHGCTAVHLCRSQDKKEAEERRKKELAELFAQAIKQPKVPAGAALQQHYDKQQQQPCM